MSKHTDRELLELAAKAHGGLVYIEDCNGWIHQDEAGNRGSWWDPITRDGDIFQLAARLEIDIMFRVVGGMRVECLPPGGPLVVESYKSVDHRLLALSCAVLRAAAEVGKKMR